MNEAPEPPRREQASEPDSVRPTKQGNDPDAIVVESRLLPPSRIGIRGVAFFLDCILVLAVASFVVWKIVLPRTHPGFIPELAEYNASVRQWMETEDSLSWNRLMRTAGKEMPEGLPEPNRPLTEGILFTLEATALCFWLYFLLGETFFAGTVGKRACRLRTVSTVIPGPPPLLSSIVRGGIKTAAIFFFFPVIMALTLVALFFNRRRQTGHDLLARTIVVDERFTTA